jgi:transformer-2 protein
MKDVPDPSRVLGVFGLSLYTTERELYSIFNKFGSIEKVTVVLDAQVTNTPFIRTYINYLVT